MQQMPLDMDTGAQFSACGRYRYSLWRRWGDGPAILWLMLNPSTADEYDNDPTVERCQRRTLAMGYDAIWVANIFALRSTDPRGLREVDDPVGSENDAAILGMAGKAGMVIGGWGSHGAFLNRSADVRKMLRDAGVRLYCLRETNRGEPGHPLYISYDVQPRPL